MSTQHTPPPSSLPPPQSGGPSSLPSFRSAEEPSAKQQKARGQKKQKPKKPRLLQTFVSLVVVLVLLGGGGFLVWQGTQGTGETEAPLPAEEIHVENPDIAGALGTDEEVEVFTDPQREGTTFEDEDHGAEASTAEEGSVPSSMTVEHMASNSVFMPAAGAYSQINADATFVDSRYTVEFQTLRVPSDPQQSVWYSQGAPLTGGDEGTTFLASHISASGVRGAFWNLHTLSGGEMVYTKDDQGAVQAWQVTQMRVLNHREFPQEYWNAEGQRQLVIATCGGQINDQGYFTDNVFAIAQPVDMPEG